MQENKTEFDKGVAKCFDLRDDPFERRLVRLASDHEPRRGESSRLAALSASHASRLQHDLGLHRALGHEPDELEEPEDQGHRLEHDRVELETRPLGRIPRRCQRDVPSLASLQVPVLHRIACLQDVEADVAQRLGANGGVHQVRQAVSNLDVLLNPAVVLILAIVLVGQAPLVAREDATGLEHPEDLAVDSSAVGSVASGLDGVHSIERVVLERKLHEVSLDELHLITEALTDGEGVAPVHLKLVDGHGLDVGACESRDVSGRPADTAAAVQKGGTLLRAQAAGQKVLMAEDGLLESLTFAPVGKVEARAPAPLVELRGKVVIGVHQVGVVLVAILGGLVLVVLVVVPIDLVVLFGARQRSQELNGMHQALVEERANTQQQHCQHRQARQRERGR
mmetsp:Transcript_104337/g.271618  ORF Transcript_104337/g.271618 Transcript_104337/m.271618 type:complete len:395 (+) Transcript_104337:311-1495(+)